MTVEVWRCTTCKRRREAGDPSLKPTLTEKYRSGKCKRCRAMRMFELEPVLEYDPADGSLHERTASGEELKQAGMAAAAAAADRTDGDWKREARAVAMGLIAKRVRFTINDITDRVGLPSHRNATGSFLNGLAREGLIGKVGYEKGDRASQHARTVTIWQAR